LPNQKSGQNGGNGTNVPAQEVIRVVENVRGRTVKLPNMGGSLAEGRGPD